MKLPQQLDLGSMQNKWATIIEPVLNNALNSGILLQNVSLDTGANVVNHRLGRKLIGWTTTRIRASAQIYDTQDTNQMPQLTLNLNSSAPVIVDIWVF